LPDTWEGFPEEGASAWTEYMAEKLFNLAAANDLGVCSRHVLHAPTRWQEATKSKGWKRELLFDFTLYEDWTGNDLRKARRIDLKERGQSTKARHLRRASIRDSFRIGRAYSFS
jgi:hypothetical protein